ncbi:hypothetical protein CRG98_040233 [Punica granatum]|nr:hypothetical protein CRG98_040233 [Punica granatum]
MKRIGTGQSFSTFEADGSCRELQHIPQKPTSDNSMQWSSQVHKQHCSEDSDFPDAVLRYINQILMEEDIDEESHMLQDSLDLQMAEKSLYEVLAQKHPPAPEKSQTFNISQNGKYPDDNFILQQDTGCVSISVNSLGQSSNNCSAVCGVTVLSTSQLSHSSSNSSLLSTVSSILDYQGCFQPVQFPRQYNWGTNEVGDGDFIANNNDEHCTDPQITKQLTQGKNGATSMEFLEQEKQSSEENLCSGVGRRKSHGREEEMGGEEEERSRKQAAVYADSELRSEAFDAVLLSSGGENLARLLSLRASLKDGVSKNLHSVEQPKGSNARRGRRKKQKEQELMDVRALLIQCAQAVASNDIRSTNSLLGKIRKYASPFGDGTQRLAHFFADGLEARLAGTGSDICRGLIRKRRVASETLKAYQLYLAASPFQRISNIVSNKTILKIAADAKTLHVIDFGILYGFQWPTLIHHLSRWPGGPPKLRITGIDLPQTGFRPAERVEETGRRLGKYAEGFNVPFEYNAIAKKWESIEVEELKIDKEEVTIVNCMYRFKNLYDETVMENSSRDIVLNLIRKINPTLFIHGIVNGTHNAPFFVTRFREALFHFSALFDMLDIIVPRINQERMLIERDMFGWEALNSVACEGWERVERPETYKQWQVRNLRAGFEQVPLDKKIVTFLTDRVMTSYHKDFVMDEVSKWLLQGWKGRFLYALSTWKPA